LKLNARIAELELVISQVVLNHKEEATSLNEAIGMTSSKLLMHAADKEKHNFVN
jgi:hypothetical protein